MSSASTSYTPTTGQDCGPYSTQSDEAPAHEPDSLNGILDCITPAPEDEDVSLHDVLTRIGDNSYMPIVLAIALLLVSPLSAIPGTPTVGGALIVIVTAQALLRREHVWLPGFIMRRSVSAERLGKAVDWLRRPVGWLDKVSRRRMLWLSRPPAVMAVYMAIILIALPWPLLEILPMVTSAGAFAVSLLAFGIMVRDGVFVLAGAAFTVIAGFGGFTIFQSVT